MTPNLSILKLIRRATQSDHRTPPKAADLHVFERTQNDEPTVGFGAVQIPVQTLLCGDFWETDYPVCDRVVEGGDRKIRLAQWFSPYELLHLVAGRCSAIDGLRKVDRSQFIAARVCQSELGISEEVEGVHANASLFFELATCRFNERFPTLDDSAGKLVFPAPGIQAEQHVAGSPVNECKRTRCLSGGRIKFFSRRILKLDEVIAAPVCRDR